MAKVTSKLQATLPKAIAEAFGIRPGDEIEWVAAGEVIRVVPLGPARRLHPANLTAEDKLRLFDEATQRQRRRQRKGPPGKTVTGRGWKREDLYRRGRSR